MDLKKEKGRERKEEMGRESKKRRQTRRKTRGRQRGEKETRKEEVVDRRRQGVVMMKGCGYQKKEGREGRKDGRRRKVQRDSSTLCIQSASLLGR